MRDLFSHFSTAQSLFQGLAGDRHHVILVTVMPTPLENPYPFQELGIDGAIDVCVPTVVDRLLCKSAHPVNDVT